MKKVLALVLSLVLVCLCAGAMAEELLPGGGSNIIYIITPSTSNPFFKTE